MKRIDQWEDLCAEPVSRLEKLAPLLALGVAFVIAWL
jgi:hypothetical protein